MPKLTTIKVFTQLLTITVLTTALKAAYNIDPELSNLCPTLEQIEQTKTQDETALARKNVEIFFEYITMEDVEPVGDGTFGKVFVHNTLKNMATNESQENGVKFMSIAEDQDNDPEEDQINLKEEVGSLMITNSLDQNHLYVPEFRYCYDVTAEFNNINENQDQLENTDNLKVPKNTAQFLVASEKLDTEYFEFMSLEEKSRVVNFDLPNRVQMAINLFKGIKIINSKIIHCDIKPENLMLKKLSETDANFLQSKGLAILESGFGIYYQILYIDFGLAQIVGDDDIECPGGTPGYMPPESFEDETEELSDIYSLVITLLNSEMSAIRTNWVSDIFDESQQLKKINERKFKGERIEHLKKQPLFKVLMKLMDHQENKENIKTILKKMNPDIENYLRDKVEELDWKNDPPSKYVFASISLYEILFTMTLHMINETSYFYRDLDGKLQKNKQELDMIELIIPKLKPEDKDYEEYSKKAEKLRLEKTLFNAQKHLKTKYFEVLLKGFDEKEDRASVDFMIQGLEEILTNYRTKNFESIKRYDQIRVEEARSKIAKMMPGNMLDFWKNRLDNRENVMVGIYGNNGRDRRRMLLV